MINSRINMVHVTSYNIVMLRDSVVYNISLDKRHEAAGVDLRGYKF